MEGLAGDMIGGTIGYIGFIILFFFLFIIRGLVFAVLVILFF